MKKTVKVIYERVKSPTPKFWIKTRNYMLAVGGLSTIIVVTGAYLPVLLVKVAGYGITTGVFGSALSQLAKVKDDDDDDDDIGEGMSKIKLTATIIIDEEGNFVSGEIDKQKTKK